MTAKYLRYKFERDLKELQDKCSHTDSEVLPYLYAPGHFGRMVSVCKDCEKILEDEN